ncbi:MAG: HlyD family efflux transporter periplasmic adaptor subunit [Ruminococcus sp.]|nr:HlyD family efflux transporter periplasmic adaptor subunit [Ruminococcus sp.]
MNDNTTINNDIKDTSAKLLKEEKEERSPARKREIIKTILIIFLAGLLILTFFSNTIMNKSLPEVTTDKVTSGKLTERVRASGMVRSNQSYQVLSDGNYTVDTINIKKGQEVKKDDVLFVLKGSESEDLSTLEDDVADMELEYEKALLELPNDFAEEKKNVRDARLALDQAIAKRDEAYQAQFTNAQEKAQLQSDKAAANRLSSLKEKLTSTINAIDSDDYTNAAPEFTGNLPALLARSKNAEDAYTSAYEIYSQAIENGADESVVNSALADANAKEAVRDRAVSDYDSAKSDIRYDLAIQLSDTEYELDEINSRLPDGEGMGMGESMSYEECVADVQTKQNSLDDAVAALAKAQSEASVTSQQTNLEMTSKKSKLDAKKAELDKLKKKSGDVEVKSKYSGVVSEVNVQPNDTTTPDYELATIDIVDQGFTIEASVSSDKAKKLKKGVKAEVINNWSGSTEAVLKEIKNSSTPGSSDKTLIFEVSGEVDSGTYVELSVPIGSSNYDTIVPKSAVKEGNDGKYVLTVKSKSSPLGNRYYAEKIKIEELASDETSVAVNAPISQGTYLITAASKNVDPGDQVRMKEK